MEEEQQSESQDNTTRNKPFIKKLGLFSLEAIKIIVLAGVTVFVVRSFIFKPFYVKGSSMEPNFHEHDYLIVDQVTYQFREPKRGEVVVFKPPTGRKDFYLKRIIGLPGERIRIENGKVIICDISCERLKEGYIEKSDLKIEGTYSVTLGKEQYFVLGDNRDNSSDSRIFGPVDRDAIVGKVWFRGYPIPRIDEFDPPPYNLDKLNS
ncbi:MAG: signal peptidase I [Candidatus Magasanikbacteria bacterium]